MFNNIGRKIKILAQVICWIGIICSVVLGVVIMATEDDLPVLGFVLMLIGPVVSWVSSFVLYGFGQLIENTERLPLNAEKSCADENKNDKEG